MSDGFLGYREISKLMSTFTYKPNWMFSVSPDAIFDEAAKIYAQMYVENSRAPFQPWDLKPEEDFDSFQIFNYSKYQSLWPSLIFSPRRVVVPVQATRIVPAMHSEAEFWNWVREYLIPEFELHERDEWFKVNGQLMFDPHKEVTK